MRLVCKWRDVGNSLILQSCFFLIWSTCYVQCMTKERKNELKEEARDMFYHGYQAYMENAYPADELMPLSCKGRWRGIEHSRGDIDEALGNFSLTLVDSLDTLFVLGDFDEFERGARLIIRDVNFDSDIIVSVFETNIRMLGGLLSIHVLSSYLQEHYSRMLWYKGEILGLATDVGYRLLPAFNTTTGIPHSKVNLKTGLRSHKLSNSKETCTACAGTMILEFAALSRLSGDPVFENVAHKAMDALWSLRHRSSDLMGTVVNIHNGDWTRRDSGVGAGIDSYYEYCLKAYILLGDERYLDRFNRHYTAVMKYISQGPLLLDVHMHRPHTNSRNFMDALLAFWPGLQVLKGDLKPAVETHEMLYQVMQRHNFLPEAFTTDFQVHWGQHPLRPEFVESTYFLYRATGDPYYLEAGAKVMSSLQRYARVPCGYAAVKDVRTSQHEDQMDSFVLSETFKYLYLLFSSPEDLPLQVDDFVFTTEAHLLPLSLARLSNLTSVPLRSQEQEDERNLVEDFDVEHARSCPSNHYLFPGHQGFAESIRLPLKNMVDKVCPTRRSIKRKLKAIDFQAGNGDHLKLLRDMGITIVGLPDGRVQLLHSYSQAKTTDDAEEGLIFMQEMVEISRSASSQPDNPPRIVSFQSQRADGVVREVVLKAGPAQFGLDLKDDVKVTASLVIGMPFRMCKDPVDDGELKHKIVIIQRGDCMFVEKARRLQKGGAVGGIVVDNSPSSSSDAAPLFAMSGDGTEDVNIPLVFLYSSDADILFKALLEDPNMKVTLAESTPDKEEILTPHEIHMDDDTSILPVADLSSDGVVEKLRSEVKRIVVERMREDAETLKKPEGDRSKSTFVLRMDEKGAIVTEAVDTVTVANQGSGSGGDLDSQLEQFAVDDLETADKEDKKSRRAFITLLRMTVHLLLALQDERPPSPIPPVSETADVTGSSTDIITNLSDVSDDIRLAIEKVFTSNKTPLSQGISRHSVDDVLSSFRTLWPENILPRRYFADLEDILLRLARSQSSHQPPPTDGWNKDKGEKLIQFMRSIRGEFATHLRQFYSKVTDRSATSVNGASDPKPNRTPDEL